ncbi:Polyubiquitin [Rhynchospora pubera]|uniref:Polyubiquitin n=1 Tax=Rhynchospora pubera TaxID=906938 RepID=A0AAV8E5G4_9POAL|nr:Polyubiquitin [Rhynchospora pubera]
MESDDQSMKIFVKMMKTIAVNVKNTDTIDTLKTMVQEVEGLALNQQELFFAGAHLECNKTLGYYNVPNNASIDLYVGDGITILIKTVKNSFPLNVKKWDTVSNIKAMIHDIEGIPPGQQTLIFSHKKLNEDQILASCGVHHNAVLHMLTRPSRTRHVTVKLFRGPAINLEVQSWYTIAEVKLIVGLPQDRQFKLFYSDQELKDEKQLAHYKIQDNALLEFKPALMQIFVMSIDAKKSIVLIVDEYEKVSDVAVRAGEKLKLDPQPFGFIYLGRRLISESTLGENGIGDNSTLSLVRNNPVGA